MDIFQIDVKGWPATYVELLKEYADQVREEVNKNGTPDELGDLALWPGFSQPPEKLRREELYKNADE